MATERVTERSDGVTSERTIERGPSDGGTTVVRSGGSGAGALIAVALVALIALVAVFLVVNANRNDPASQVAEAASSIAGSASRAADAAADSAAAVAPAR